MDLILDQQNPRFVRIDNGDPGAIRKYMATYEDACSLAGDINTNKGLLLGERIVVIRENGQNIVMEGNRRTCALQFLLDRSLIPDRFEHRIPTASADTIVSISQIEVDVAPNRDYAVNLMGKRHIVGVKRWKPLAKKRFFAGMFMNGNSISQLSSITGISVTNIRKDVKDYKFLLSASGNYKIAHPEFDEDIITYTIDPFLRIFVARQQTLAGLKAPSEILKLRYDNQENTLSDLPAGVFDQIVELVFKATIVDGIVTTRGTLFDVSGVELLLESVPGSPGNGPTPTSTPTPTPTPNPTPTPTPTPTPNPRPTPDPDPTPVPNPTPVPTPNPRPTPGGGPPPSFFEHISWHGKLDPGNMDHVGLIVALDELHRMSTEFCRANGRNEKIYHLFPVGAGMLLRTAYEQALKLQLKKAGLWIQFIAPFTLRNSFPMLSHVEVNVQSNSNVALPAQTMRTAFGRILHANQRDFLNANIHNPGLIRATYATLEGIANAGMVSLIQLIIDNL